MAQDDLSDIGMLPSEVVQLPPEIVKSGTQQTAKRAVEILLAQNEGFHCPTGPERRALLVAFARANKVLYGAAFDVVRSSVPVDYGDIEDISRNLANITIYEIKSTNRTNIGPTLAGYFFALSTAELLVAQNLGEKFRFAFVNTITETYLDMPLRDVFARAKGIYPTWSIRF